MMGANKETKLKYCFELQKGKLPKGLTDENSDNLPVYLSMDYLRGNNNDLKYVVNSRNTVLAENNDILILWDGSNAGEILRAKYGVISSTTAKISPNNNVTKNYLFFLLKSHESYIKEMSIGMGIPHVDPQELLNSSFLIPSIEEQTAIANYLDQKTTQIDELIADKEKLLKLYEEEKTAVINNLVTGKKVWNGNAWAEPVEVKDSGIEWLGKIPKHWEVKKLKFVLKSMNHIRVPLSAEERGQMINRRYDYYGASGVIDIVESYLFDEPLLLIGEDGANLITRSKRLVYIAKGQYWVNNHAHILKPKYGILEYYCELLELYDYTIWISGSAQPKLTSENLANINIIVPPQEEQEIIVNYIKSETLHLDSKIKNTQKLIRLLKEYRTALISEVVTGKVKVV